MRMRWTVLGWDCNKDEEDVYDEVKEDWDGADEEEKDEDYDEDNEYDKEDVRM